MLNGLVKFDFVGLFVPCDGKRSPHDINSSPFGKQSIFIIVIIRRIIKLNATTRKKEAFILKIKNKNTFKIIENIFFFFDATLQQQINL